MCPFWYQEDFCVENIRNEGIIECDGISIPGGVLLRVEMSQCVGRLEFGAMLGEQKRRVLFRLII